MVVAAFIGSPPMNLLPGTIQRGRLVVGAFDSVLGREGIGDGPVTVGLRPGALSFAGHGIPGRVDLVEDLGDSSIVNVEVGEQLVKVRTQHRPEVREGEAVHLHFDAAALHLFDRDSGARL
jgi:multiple sugar transport system ATP-binding protein